MKHNPNRVLIGIAIGLIVSMIGITVYYNYIGTQISSLMQADFREKIKNCTDSNDALSLRITNATKRYEDDEMTIQQNNEMITTLNNRIIMLTVEYNKSIAEKSALEEEIRILNRSIIAGMQYCQSAEASANKTSSLLDDCQRRLSTANSQIDSDIKKLNETDAKIKKYEQIIADIERQISFDEINDTYSALNEMRAYITPTYIGNQTVREKLSHYLTDIERDTDSIYSKMKSINKSVTEEI